MAILDDPRKKNLSPEKPITLKKTTSSFCLDCVIDWCKIRNKVTYCSQKYKGIRCYSCSDTKCTIKKRAGA
ncbi:hypothetical protein DRO91_04635 [Candidatus Heimdallarchaeota archaeon]|nr:MAG: hypothetical protein DRO63_01485 [Candidatus Gerdarchaeota archaeon]RLI71577.1 MAG: hypothetical protein DRP02_04315 [Candidatus Gerdarchaeota archaeon]RLI72302.1 MAG: hypothetical protein DRO91_04635 [Candidatus Heimdallarchaeota archaeon]